MGTPMGMKWPRIKEETLSEIESRMPQFLFYRRIDKKRKLCQCSACGNSGVAEISGKNGEAVLCPFCMELVELKCSSRLRDDAPSLKRHINVIYFSNRSGSLWAVGARLERTFCREEYDAPWRSSMDVIPFEVWNFAPGTAEEYRQGYGLYGAYAGMGWYGPVRPREPKTGGMTGNNVYSLWQTEELDKTDMRYWRAVHDTIDSDPFEDGVETSGTIRELTAYAERPKLELVCKWGLLDVANDWVWRRITNDHTANWKANTPWEFLKISKADWGLYRKSLNASIELLTANRRVFKLPVREVLGIADQLGRPEYWIKNATKITRRGIGLKDQIKYIKRQTGRVMDPVGKLRFWRDYLDMAEKAGRDMSQQGTLMPRDLFDAHDEMVEYARLRAQAERERRETRCREEKQKAMEQASREYRERWEKLRKKYEYRSGGMMIKVPEDGEEIIQEGNVLHICVGGYAARHLTGQTTIQFLRRERKPGTPYICIEIREKDNTIVQIHGYRNEFLGNGRRARNPKDRFRPFLSEWLGWVKAGSKRTGKASRKDETA